MQITFVLQYNFKHSVVDRGGGADTRRHGERQHRKTVAGDVLLDGYLKKTVTHDILSRRRIMKKPERKNKEEKSSATNRSWILFKWGKIKGVKILSLGQSRET